MCIIERTYPICHTEKAGDNMTKEKLVIFEKEYPLAYLTVKDCWMSAMAMVCVIFGRDIKILNDFAWFFYGRKNKQINSLEDIITNQINIDFGGDEGTDEYQQSRLLEHNLDLKIRYFSKLKVSKEKSILKDCICFVIWFDAYDCKWNPMFNKKHIMHCATGCFVEGKHYVFDGLRGANFFYLSEEELFGLAKYFFLYEENDQLRNEAKKSTYCGCSKNIQMFIEDLDSVRENIMIDKTLCDKESAKLFIRIFRNQYEKIAGLLDLNPKDPYLEMLLQYWEKASILAAKVCFLENEKRRVSYENLCDCLHEIASKIGEKDDGYL